MSNLYSILLARYNLFPKVKTEGMHALPPLILFTSAHVRSLPRYHSNAIIFTMLISKAGMYLCHLFEY